jgi:predicted ferric reductase
MATLTQAGPTPVARRLAQPRTWPIRPADVAATLLAVGLLVVGMWVVHGGLDRLGTPAGLATGLGQLMALTGTYLALAQIVLMARVPWIDHVVGSDKLMVWHRWLGIGTITLILGHVVLTTAGWAMASGSGIVAEFLAMNEMWDVLIATVGTVLMTVVAVTSIRTIRRRLSYEAWYGLHLYAYLGIALAFSHQITIGADFIGDPVALWFWIGLYVVTFGLLIWYRVLTPIRVSARHQLRVVAVVPEVPSVVSIYLAGRDLQALPLAAGQFFHIRFLRRGGWWRPHPFSISAAPNGEYLRLTIKDLGDDSQRMMSMPQGTPVFIEGPYGAFTKNVVRQDRVVMLAGGVGVTPLRSIFEDLTPGAQHVTFLYREGEPSETIFREELLGLAARHGAELRFLEGHRGTPQMPVDPLAPEWLYSLAPDIAESDVLVCGSPSFTKRVLASLATLGVPARQIHAERFGY